MTGRQPHHEPGPRAGISEIYVHGRRGQTASSDPLNAPNPSAQTLDARPQSGDRPSGVDDVFPLKKTRNRRASLSYRSHHQRTMGTRLVARRADRTRDELHWTGRGAHGREPGL